MSNTDADFGFGESEAELRDVARRFLADHLPTTVLRELVAADPEAVYDRGDEPGWDRELWARIVGMGWPSLAVPEDAGGFPVSMAGLTGVVEETGFHALPSPLLSTISDIDCAVDCISVAADDTLSTTPRTLASKPSAALSTCPR